MKGKFFLAVAVCLFLAGATRAQNLITIVEAETQVILQENAAQISLVASNSRNNFDGVIFLELLDVKGAVRSATEQRRKIKRGRETYKISLPLGGLMQTNSNDIGWFRLRCRLTNISGKLQTESIVSLSEIIKDIFELRVTASENVFSGMEYRARVRAFQPFTNEPVKNVRISGEITLELDTDDEDDELKVKASGESDAKGFAALNFKIPPNARLDYNGSLKINGEKYGIKREVKEDLNTITNDLSVYLNTDKPLYQPGQTLNTRGILLKGISGATAVSADEKLEFIIEDEEDTVLYRETVKTSRFGIAAISWQIPENAKLGNYRIRVEDDDGDFLAGENFKVSRYDLPNFAVSVKPDRNFYLPSNVFAEVEVRADYLFGKPVTAGTVKVVQETEREWNYREQKWNIREDRAFEGETDANGKFVARIDLTRAHGNLGSESYRRYKDLNFAAYFTDPTTNRTEQRRFDLRLTKEAVHVYLIGETYNRNPKLPLVYYVSTFYADGAPAACRIEVEGRYENESGKFKVARLATNAYGAGKLEFVAPRIAGDDKDLELKIRAVDDKKQTGTFEEETDFDTDDALQIQTKKTIHKTGEGIEAEIVSTKNDALVYLDVVKNLSVIDSRFVQLKNGRAVVNVPFQPNFKGDLTVAAYAEEADEKDGGTELIRDAVGVIYPAPGNLKLDAEFSQTIYRPNEEARVNFNVLAGDKSPLESALGIIVFDKAIEERARADAEFGGDFNLFRNFNGLLGDDGGFGSLSRRDLDELDLSKPVSGDLQLAAEIMLHDRYYYPQTSQSDNHTQAQSVFEEYFKTQFAPVETVLKNAYLKNFAHPVDEISLRKILGENRLEFDALRDPWGNNYRPVFEIDKEKNILRFATAGADKQFDTKDDFSVLGLSFEYFLPIGKAIDRAAADYHARTKSFIRDYATLKNELKKQDIDLDNLRDRWNRKYRIEFGAAQRKYTIRLESRGANGIAEAGNWDKDDFDVWTNEIDYFAETENEIQTVLSRYVKENKFFPRDAESFKRALQSNGVDAEQIKDGYNQTVYLTTNVYSRYSDQVKIEYTGKVGEKAVQKTVVVPITQEIVSLKLRSRGADNEEGTADDFDLASFSGVVSEQEKSDAKPKTQISVVPNSATKGAIRGVVKDASGAVVPGAKVEATNAETEEKFAVASNEDGAFLIENLPSGIYKVSAEAVGFMTAVLENASVRAQTVIEVDITLNAGNATTVVEVTSGVASIDTTANRMVGSGSGDGMGNGGSGGIEKEKNVSENKILDEKSTPRLREYFPETLVWQPELVTGKNGKAELKFKLGDNITSWKLYAVASNAEGKIGIVEREIKSFQPFFADLEPPKFLTVGDEIALPVQIRNYTNAKQRVAVEMAKGDWFDFTNQANQQIEVAPNASQNAIFGFRANAAIKVGKQQVTAIAGKDSDAIEKPVTVRPNGKEIVQTQSEIFRDAISFDVNFPANALPQTQRAEMKIYPNLLAHVAESIEGLLQRPYGCGEQTVSSTYPNLMILKFAPKDEKLRARAENFLRKGYERLLGYQQADGGFSVWTKDAPDIALTAYALRFLTDAKTLIAVDDDVIKRAQNWLIRQQRADGSWTRQYNWEKTEDDRRAKLMTAYATRTLAMIEKDAKEKSKEAQTSLQRGLEYLKTRSAEIDEPYALALFGLASLDAGSIDAAKTIAAKLETMAIREGAGAYWNLETNTPFYGWGTAGRIETTALVVQLLIKSQNRLEAENNEQSSNRQTASLISKGTQFLLKNKDRYGVWYSTQTTVNVLAAFLAAIGDEVENKIPAENRGAEVFVNDQKFKDVTLPPENAPAFPVTLDLPVNVNANRIEIKIGGNKSAVMAQIVGTHYIRWQDFEANGKTENQSRALRLAYDCDKREAKPTEEISCRVEAERIGFKGYGMLLAEIGLPPGADVDRASLEKAREENWNFSRYDVLPDRIIVYLWAQAGGVKFDFKFKPRYGINAQTAPSIVYDYYNAEAQATVAPLKFSVK